MILFEEKFIVFFDAFRAVSETTFEMSKYDYLTACAMVLFGGLPVNLLLNQKIFLNSLKDNINKENIIAILFGFVTTLFILYNLEYILEILTGWSSYFVIFFTISSMIFYFFIFFYGKIN